MDTCPDCGASVASDQATCPDCGAELHERTVSFPAVGESAPETPHPASHDVAEGPVLVVRRGPEVGERFYLEQPRLTVGRDPGSDIFLNDITVSRSHATLEVQDGEVSVADTGSLNGVYVNGVSVERSALHNGDSLQVGRFQMVFISGRGE